MNRVSALVFLVVFITTLLASCTSESTTDAAEKAFARSQQYVEQGQYRAATIEVKNALQQDPENLTYLLWYAEIATEIGSPYQAELILLNSETKSAELFAKLADLQLQQQKFLSAQETISQLESLDPDHPDISWLTARQIILAGQESRGLELLEKEASEHSENGKFTESYILTMLEKGLAEDALTWLERSIEMEDQVSHQYLYGSVYLANGQLNEAESALTQALANYPDTDVLTNTENRMLEALIELSVQLGKLDKAIIYRNVIQTSNPDAYLAKQQYEEALNAVSNGDLATAKRLFEDILVQYPNNQQAALLLGLIHIEEGESAAGEQLLSENLNTETAPTTLIKATALAQTEQGKSDQALTVLEQALLANPDDAELLGLYGTILLGTEKQKEGIAAISKALELDASLIRLRLLLGQHFYEMNQPDLALGHLRKAYHSNNRDWAIVNFYLELLLATDNMTEAREIYQNLIERSDQDANALWLAAMIDYRTGDKETAMKLLQQSHQLDSTNITVIETLARLYSELLLFDSAADMWLTALSLQPMQADYLAEAVAVRRDFYSQQETLEWLAEKAINQPEISDRINTVIVELHLLEGELEAAKSVAQRYQGETTEYANTIFGNILTFEAQAYLRSAEPQKALAILSEAEEKLPENSTIRLLKAEAFQTMGDHERAVSELDVLISTGNISYRVVNEKTSSLATLNKTDEAFEFINQYWQTQPNEQLAGQYFSLLQKQSPTKVEAESEQWLEANPESTVALTTLANLAISRQENNEALTLYDRILEVQPTSISALNNSAWLLKDSNPEEALVRAEKAANLAPSSASVLDTYAWILYLNGQQEEALKHIEVALSLDPENEYIQQHKAQISR